MVFSEKCYYFMNLVFFEFSVFQNRKKKKTQTCSLCFLYSLCFSKQKTVFKNYKQTNPKYFNLYLALHLKTIVLDVRSFEATSLGDSL